MRTLEQLQDKLKTYGDAEYIWTDAGNIAWHYATGGNIEVLFIEAAPLFGCVMYQKMIDALQSRGERPYHSVFGFCLGSNEKAKRFYRKMGWNVVELGKSIYAYDDTTLVWTTWDNLVARLKG